MSINIKNKIIYALIACLLLVICGGFYFYQTSFLKRELVHQKCPEDYAEDDAGTEEYKDTMVNWTTDFFEEHPEATMSDWSKAKTQLWLDNNCTVAIQRLKLSGEVAELKPYELVDYEIQNALSNATQTPFYTSEYGFSFDYPDSMRVMTDPESTDNNFQIFIIPNSHAASEDEPMNAVVISGARNSPPITPLQWLNGPNSGADMSKGYDRINVDGQEAISLEGGAWVVVNMPDGKTRLSITTLPSQKPTRGLVDTMSSVINSIVFTNQ